jgi:hypothetical protein
VKYLSVIFLLSLLSGPAFSQDEFRKVDNEAFQTGEKLTFRFYYDAWLTGKVTAGIGVIKVKESGRTFNDREAYLIEADGKSKGMFNWFYKVHDRFESYVDKDFIAPHYFVRRTREGGYTKDDEYTFDQTNHTVTTRTVKMAIPPYTQDFLSAIYYARTLNGDTLQIGDIIPISFFLDDSVYVSSIVFEGRDTIEVELGTFRCLRFRPGLITGEVFSDKYPMTLWITDDKNHLPVLAKSKIIVGNLKAELMEYEGLKNEPVSLIEKKE